METNPKTTEKHAWKLIVYFNSGPRTDGMTFRCSKRVRAIKVLEKYPGKYRFAILYHNGEEMERFKPET